MLAEVARRTRKRRRKPLLRQNILLLTALFIAIQWTSQSPLCHAEDADMYYGNDGGDDFYSIEDDTYYTNLPTTSPPTKYPTAAPITSGPTPSPTYYPSAQPSVRPSRARIDFYEVDIDDYTVEAQSAEMYISSISDVILCLLCTFFWILWLVGTIFPTKIQHLYKSEGVVVVGDVVESYTTPAQSAHDGMAVEDSASEMMNTGGVVVVGGDTFDTVNNLPSYHAIVSYVVPGPVALGRRRIRRRNNNKQQPPNGPSNNYYLQHEGDNARMTQTSTQIDSSHHALAELTAKLSADHVKASMALKGTPPRPPRTSSRLSTKITSPESPESLRGEGLRSRKLSKISEESVKQPNAKSLIDSCTKSFDSNERVVQDRMDGVSKKGYYLYNKFDKSDYGPSDGNGEIWEDEYENPEMIGNLFHSLGLSGFIVNKDKSVEKKPSPVRVKKRFETSEFLKRGSKCVEIIVLPGQPGSGILKDEFEMEEDYMLTGTVSDDQDDFGRDSMENEVHSGHMGDATAGIIGVVLSAVSVIGAVHGALTLPYQKRVYGWILVIGTLSFMWPIAMLTYKSVNKLRLFALNKIISFEPCGDKTGLYGLSKLPRAKLTTCSDNSGKGSEGSGAEYVIMLDTNDTDGKRGIWSQDESSAVSSLSGGNHIV